jgi:hypothetical protein
MQGMSKDDKARAQQALADLMEALGYETSTQHDNVTKVEIEGGIVNVTHSYIIAEV